MDLRSAYLWERILVHSPDMLMAGLGYYLARFPSMGWARVLGQVMLAVYAIALIGLYISPEPFDAWGPVVAALGILFAQLAGSLRSQKTPPRKTPQSKGWRYLGK